MAKYEIVKSEEIKYGSNSFLEVALKEVVGENGEASRFISLSKGWIPREAEEANARRFKSGIGFPADKELVEKFIEALQEMAKEAKNAPSPKPSAASESSESEEEVEA